MKVAIATTDGKHIDEHFGRAKMFAIYNFVNGNSIFEEVRTVSENAINSESTNEESIEVEKINRVINTISDCAIMYCADIGPFAAARVVRSKIHPIKVPEGSTQEEKQRRSIKKEIGRLTKIMENPPIWIQKIQMNELQKKLVL